MKPYYDDGMATIYHGDCREIAPPLGTGFAIVSDPPYGMAFDVNWGRFSGFGVGATREGKDWDPVVGDDGPFDPSPWLGYPACVLWGANHFAQRVPVGTLLVWVKRRPEHYGMFLSDAEIAWKSGGYGIYLGLHEWHGAASKRGENTSSHPTQKPVAVMRWCIEMADPHGKLTILDPFMGSGTTLVAAKNLGRKSIGIEIEEKYCEIAAERLSQEVLAL